MTQFKGTHSVRRDGKGRVSIPAAFRAVLKGDHPVTPGPNGAVVLRPSHKHPCVEGWHPAAFEAQGSQIQQLPRFSDEEDDLALALYSDAVDAEPDKEGRIVLPRELADHAGLGEEVTFVGAGSHFQIWEPAAAQRRIAEARERARVLRMTLPPIATAAGGGK
jgi:MraZ protein